MKSNRNQRSYGGQPLTARDAVAMTKVVTHEYDGSRVPNTVYRAIRKAARKGKREIRVKGLNSIQISKLKECGFEIPAPALLQEWGTEVIRW